MAIHGRVDILDAFCKGCELCVSACPREALILDAQRLTPRGYHPAALKADHACTGCGICAVVCPEAAIEVLREERRPAPAGSLR